MAFLGIDTSNYTTSLALCENGVVIQDCRRLLAVKKNEVGLRQSDALFQHWNNLPVLLKETLSGFNGHIEGIVVSVKPRPVEGSYMPCFTAGHNTAKMLSDLLNVPMFELTHQEGHILSAAYGNNIDFSKAVICAHLSGGTLELVRVFCGKIEIVGRTKDISYGKLLDRSGVLMGFDFPCGKYIDENALGFTVPQGYKNPLPKISLNDAGLNISGIESAVKRLAEKMPSGELSYCIMERISQSLSALIDSIRTDEEVLICGGVAASEFIRSSCAGSNYKFANKELCSDNAVGLALSKGERPWL